MLTIFDGAEIVHRAKAKIERAKRNANVHEDIEIMEELVALVEQQQEGLRAAAGVTTRL